MHRIQTLSQYNTIDNNKETVYWYEVLIYCLVKKGTDYYVVCAIRLKKRKQEEIYIFNAFFFLHWKIFGLINKQPTSGWLTIRWERWELREWKTVRGRDMKETSQDSFSYSIMFVFVWIHSKI